MKTSLQCRAEMLMYNGGGMSLLRRQALAWLQTVLGESLLAAPATTIGQQQKLAWLLSSLLSLFYLLYSSLPVCLQPHA